MPKSPTSFGCDRGRLQLEGFREHKSSQHRSVTATGSAWLAHRTLPVIITIVTQEQQAKANPILFPMEQAEGIV